MIVTMVRRMTFAVVLVVAVAVPAAAQAAKPQLLTVPPLVTNTQTQTFEFTIANWNYYECSLDGSAFQFCAPPVTYTSLPDGSHAFAVRANHNVPDCPPLDPDCGVFMAVTSDVSTFTFIVDRTRPEVSFTAGPKQGSSSRVRTVNIAFASEPGSTFVCTFDKRTPEPCESAVEWRNIEPGLHRVRVQATDAAGNVGDGSSLEFAVNTRTVTYRSINKTSAQRCVKRKLKRRGKVVRTKSGKIRYKTTCKRVRF